MKKIVRMKRLKQLDKEFDEIFWSGNSFDDLYDTFNYNKSDPKSKIFCSAFEEWKKSNKVKRNNFKILSKHVKVRKNSRTQLRRTI